MLRRVLRLVALYAAVAFAGCGGGAPAPKETLQNGVVALVRADGATMNPLAAQTLQDYNIYCQLLYQSLVYIGPDYLPHPRLATKWTFSPDGRHVTVDLRRGVRWSDGVPFTSHDVVVSFQVMTNPDVAFGNYGDVKYIHRVTAAGPYRAIFDLDYPSAEFVLTVMSQEWMMPAHIIEKIPPVQQRFSSLGEHPVGTGPYTLKSWQHDTEAVFVRNPYSWQSPKIDRIDYKTIFNDQSEAEALANGSADLIDDLSLLQYNLLKRIAPHVILVTNPSLFLDVVVYNNDRPGLNDVAVRQAMVYGYDRKDLVSGFFQNDVEYTDSLVPAALTYWYDPKVPKYPYEPAKARALLDAAGWVPGPDGVRHKGATRLSFEMMLNQGSAEQTDEMLTFVADMKTIGIDVRLRLLDFPSLIGREFSGDYDMAASGQGGGFDPDFTSIFDSHQIPPNGANVSHLRDKIVDETLHDGLTTLDPAKRRVIYNRMQEELGRQQPMMFQHGRFSALAHSARLHIDRATIMQSPYLFYNVEDWYLKP